ncbi:hypothetical protein BKA80DRAFT_94860 [Phyllosticta citrichinensis]
MGCGHKQVCKSSLVRGKCLRASEKDGPWQTAKCRQGPAGKGTQRSASIQISNESLPRRESSSSPLQAKKASQRTVAQSSIGWPNTEIRKEGCCGKNEREAHSNSAETLWLVAVDVAFRDFIYARDWGVFLACALALSWLSRCVRVGLFVPLHHHKQPPLKYTGDQIVRLS